MHRTNAARPRRSELAVTRPVRPLPLSAVARRRLDVLAGAIGRRADVPSLHPHLDAMLAGAAHRSTHEDPRFRSDVGDDATPFELSLAFGAETDLRLLAEPQGAIASLASNRDAALEVVRALADAGHASCERLERVRDLFLPAEPRGAFAMWLAMGGPTHAPDVKVYLSPEAQGPALAPALVEEALVRLGFGASWPLLSRTLLARHGLDELKYFALDLSPRAGARVKIYARHHDATIDDAERAASAARSHVPGEIAAFLRAVGARERFDRRPLATCLAYVARDDARPATATAYVPVNDYAPHDDAIRARVARFLEVHGIDPATYDTASRAYARRPLEDGIGTQSYVAFKRRAGAPVVTVYFAAEAYRPGAVAQVAPPPRARSAAELVRRVEASSIARHPFWRRLAREPVSLGTVSLLLESARVALVRGLCRRVATTIARVEEPRIRSPLAALLNDELGHGAADRAHEVFFERMRAAFAPYALALPEDVLLAPARRLAAEIDALHLERAPYEGLGALLMSERFGAEVDAAMAGLLARQTTIPPAELAWIQVHRELEEGHAEGTLALARFVPAAHIEEVERGALALEAAASRFFDGLYELCSGGVA